MCPTDDFSSRLSVCVETKSQDVDGFCPGRADFTEGTPRILRRIAPHLVPAEGFPGEFRPLFGQLRRRIRGPSNHVTYERLCVAKTQRAGWISNGINKRTHALHTTERRGICRRHERPLLQLCKAKEHYLVRNHGRIRPVILHVLKQLNAARWVRSE